MSYRQGQACPRCECPVQLVGQGDMYEGESGHCWCPNCGWDEESDEESDEGEEDEIQKRLDYLRQEILAERISYGELAELQDLAPHIPPGDLLLLEWAGVPEFPNDHGGGK